MTARAPLRSHVRRNGRFLDGVAYVSHFHVPNTVRGVSILLISGVLLIAMGAIWGWYYSSVLFPSQQAAAQEQCEGGGSIQPCATLAPADWMSPTAYLFGFMLVLVGAILRFGTSEGPKRSGADSGRSSPFVEKECLL